MKDKRFITGVVISGIWIAIAIFLVCTQTHPTELNAWGDFIAGFSAPLAFLWLVLGYMQQGEELRNSADALNLQAKELKNSVEQQMQLVAVTREQIRIDLEKLSEERVLRRRAALPRFVATREHSVGVPPNMQFYFVVKNLGVVATDVKVTYEGGGAPSPRKYSTFDNQTELRESVQYRTDCEFLMKIDFEDWTGQRGIAEIPFKVGPTELEIGGTKAATL